MFKTILVALDCSESTQMVIDALEQLQIQPQTKIILVHVLPSVDQESEREPERPHQSTSAVYQQVEKQLQKYQSQVSGSQIDLTRGDPAEEIIRLANIYQANLIVIGTRGLKGVKRIIEGSVSDQVVADAPCSVLVVKSQVRVKSVSTLDV